MCFGGNDSPPPVNPNYNPAPYSLDNSHSAVQATVTPGEPDTPTKVDPNSPVETQSTSVPTAPGLNLRSM